MSMPKAILVNRLRNELSDIGPEMGISVSKIPDDLALPFAINVTLRNTRAYSAPNIPRPEQSFTIFLGEDYPYEKPKVKWNSPIYHPNIMSPSEGGSVCVTGLDHWDADSNLLDFIKSLKELVNYPNPFNPLVTHTCLSAAQWFLRNA